jgi:hypothetical protein
MFNSKGFLGFLFLPLSALASQPIIVSASSAITPGSTKT